METKALINAIFEEIMNKKRLGAADDLIHPEFVTHFLTGDVTGREAFKGFCQQWFDAFPDIHCTIDHVVVEGDTAAWQVHFTGTNTGPLMGMPPTGKSIDMHGVNMGRVKDGMAIEHWDGNDMLQMLQQLGIVPAMSPA